MVTYGWEKTNMKYGLIGEKLGHSYSKIIHEQLIDNYKYELQPLDKNELASFMKEKNFSAINVTIPYKQTILPYLDEISDTAKQIGAVNTVVNKEGKLIGYNTDYLGFVYTLKKHNLQIKDKKVLIMGNGGASKAIQTAIYNEQPKEVVIVDLVKEAGILSIEEVYTNHLDCEVIINTTPIGMYPKIDGTSVDITKFKNCFACIDAVYNPLRTDFVLSAQALGIKGINGLEMLVAQAKYALELFKNITIEDSEINRIYKEILLETSNIVLIGMPSCGKSTIGRKLAKKLNKEFIDIDTKIVEEIQMPISEYFAKNGEPAFREIETRICKEVSIKTNCIISCGGGIVKNKKNIFHLKHNGLIVHLNRDIEKLISDDSRPLSSSKEAIAKLWKERDSLYRSSGELIIDNNGCMESTIQNICEEYKKHITDINQ